MRWDGNGWWVPCKPRSGVPNGLQHWVGSAGQTGQAIGTGRSKSVVPLLLLLAPWLPCASCPWASGDGGEARVSNRGALRCAWTGPVSFIGGGESAGECQASPQVDPRDHADREVLIDWRGQSKQEGQSWGEQSRLDAIAPGPWAPQKRPGLPNSTLHIPKPIGGCNNKVGTEKQKAQEPGGTMSGAVVASGQQA